MRNFSKGLLCLLVFLSFHQITQGTKKKSAVIVLNDLKEFKKLLRTRNNVLVLFIVRSNSSDPTEENLKAVSNIVRGEATVAFVNCYNAEVKKLCKSLKINKDKPYYIKHYNNGKFNIDYDRNVSKLSILRFLKDPTGNLPWEEDPAAMDVLHLSSFEDLARFLRRGFGNKLITMVLLHAPWCKLCVQIKPEYALAATKLKTKANLVAINIDSPVKHKFQDLYNISGYPTLLYFQNGKYKSQYQGKITSNNIVQFIQRATSETTTRPEHKNSHDIPIHGWPHSYNVIHLGVGNFQKALETEDRALVVFYKPSNEQCQYFRPVVERASQLLREAKVMGILVAVDLDVHFELEEAYRITMLPTVKFFKNGRHSFDISNLRDERSLIELMAEDHEWPADEMSWSKEESSVKHLTIQNFRSTIRKIKHALLIFYAPWCSQCKQLQPEWNRAAANFVLEPNVLFATIDCIQEKQLCNLHDITTYPTILYLNSLQKIASRYKESRTELHFVNFMHRKLGNGPKSENSTSPQDYGFDSKITILTDDTFQSAIASEKPTFVMFFATWCAHCEDTKPSFNKLLGKIKSSANIVAVDAGSNMNVTDIAKVQSLPALKLFSSGNLVADYEGDRSTEDMYKFLKSHISSAKNEL